MKVVGMNVIFPRL